MLYRVIFFIFVTMILEDLFSSFDIKNDVFYTSLKLKMCRDAEIVTRISLVLPCTSQKILDV